MEIPWEDLTEEEKKNCYKSYIDDIVHVWGDNAIILSYEEWCKESEDYGWAII